MVRVSAAIAVAVVVVCGLPVTCEAAEERPVGEMALSLLRPAPQPEPEAQLGSSIRRLLSAPLGKPRLPVDFIPRVYSEEALHLAEWSVSLSGEDRRFFPPDDLYPGASVPLITRPLPGSASSARFASLSRTSAAHLLDGRKASAVGRLAANPHLVYSRLEIHVDRSAFTLTLYAFKGAERKVLYETKVGLGSAEFPTPKGSYYVARIYDDHPLWIPPQDRWWAWGQRPSRSVYGGHMMPFFSKRTVLGSAPKNGGTDMIEPKVKMIDYGMYRIHGTDSPWSVGSNQSHGCVRMLNKTVKALADNLKIYAGVTNRGESANGTYVNLAKPVKLVLH